MQNKANFPDDQMNVTSIMTTDYENKTPGESEKNKANSKPNKANFPTPVGQTNPIYRGVASGEAGTCRGVASGEDGTCRGVASGEDGSNPPPAGSSAASKSLSFAWQLVREHTDSSIKSLPKIAENTLSVEKTSHKEENQIKIRLIKECKNVSEFI